MDDKDRHTLKALRQAIADMEELPDETPVILAFDPMGNTYSPLDSIAGRIFIGDPSDFPEAARQPDGSIPAVYLFPTFEVESD
ncbi:hypothetical protein [Embleya sp. NPDC059237]|uniref:hypothetical protein n=1 Tax=Embleya sp. NPDC059237 TaxID=3346784 RepID=UPI0036A1AF6E